MKKLKLLVFTFLSLILLPSLVMAASGSITVSGTEKVVVGNKVTLTVTLSSSTAIGSWEMSLDYNKSYLQLTSSSAEAGGVKMAGYATGANGTKKKTYTFTFKALKTGSTKVSVDMYDVYANDFSSMSITSGSKNLKIITQEELEASYSKDNDLKDLSVEGYTISPEFNKDTLNYEVEVPEGTTTVNVIATPNDGKSSVIGAGNVEVTAGSNNLSIIVRAENGSEKTYNLVVEVIDANPIDVTVDGEKYTVIKLRSNFTCPELYTESEVEIDGFQIPACVNEKTKYTLVGLKNKDGEALSFIYQNGKYQKYNEVTGTSLKIIILDYEGDLPGLTKANSMIDGKTYAVSNYEGNSDYYVVYGMNVATGEKGYYLYDTINKTFTLYNNDQIEDLSKTNQIYLCIIGTFGATLILSFICMIHMSHKNKRVQKKENIVNEPKKVNEIKEEVKKEEKPKKKNKKEKEKVKEEPVEKELEENKIEEINSKKEETDETETYYLFESDRRKSQKKKRN